MRDDKIYSSFYYSLGLHSFFFIAIVLYLLFGTPSRKMVSIVVSLVESPTKGASEEPEEASTQPAEEEQRTTITHDVKPKKSLADERIAALEAKKRVERLAAAKRQLSISKSSTKASLNSTSGGGTYDSLIQGRITRNWANADFLNKNRGLIAIINIRIARNGNVTILGFEKKSGNPLFDREALRAITDSSPLPPPVTEVEMNLRFNP
jgi:TonB family protein